jgi:flavin reductase (DIM6/NTAB) family NADH-FMN oxidoreductase RutF
MTFSVAEKAVRERFTSALRRVPAAVCLVTGYVDLRPWGQTVSAFASVSADPPTVLVCVNRSTVTCASLEHSGAFGVSFLSEAQLPVAEAGSALGAPKFLEQHTSEEQMGYSPEYGFGAGSVECGAARQYYWSDAPASSPVVHGALCHLDCSVDRLVDASTHAVVIGRVDAIIDGETGQRPLIYHDRHFHALGPRISAARIHEEQTRSS